VRQAVLGESTPSETLWLPLLLPLLQVLRVLRTWAFSADWL
jgi:hypothetical protein